jgi:hypothetical protein
MQKYQKRTEHDGQPNKQRLLSTDKIGKITSNRRCRNASE